MIVESITGNLLSEEMTTRIFNPASLDSTFLDIEQDHYGLYAHAWFDLIGSGSSVDLDAMGIPRDAAWSSSWADGAIVATAADLARFSHALLVEKSILSPATLAEMTDFSATQNEYGLGIYPTFSTCENWIGHNGEFVYTSEWAFFESTGTSIVLLYNESFANGFLPIQNITSLCEILKGITSTNDLSPIELDLVKIHPNPAKEFVHFSIPFNYQHLDIQIYSVDGRIVKFAKTIHSKESLDVSDLASGVYFVKIQTEKGQFVEKLVLR